MPIPTNVITPEPLITATQESRFRSTGLELFGTGVGEGLQYSTPGAVGRLASWYAAGNDERIDEETWKASPHYREGLAYDTGMTMARAEILAYRKDIETRRNFIKEHAASSGSAMALGIMGNIVGNIPDPINYIPIVGQATKAWMISKIGRIAATAAKGAIEATAGSLITQPLILAAEKQSQGDYDVAMAMQNVLASTVFGGLFGTVAEGVGRLRTKTHVDGVSMGVDDLTGGRPVNVQSAMETELARIRQEKVSLLDNLKKQKSEIETKLSAEQPFVKHEDVLNAIRQDVERGEAGYRMPVKDEYGVITEYKGISPGFPEYFQNKGYGKKEVLNIIDKAVEGKKLTEKQNNILSDIVEGKTKELESAKYMIETEAASKPRPSAAIQDIGLETGDKFKIYGEQYVVKGFDEEGKIMLGTGQTEGEAVIVLDTTDSLPMPDEGSIVKKITPELSAVNKQISDLEAELQGRPLDFSTNEEVFVAPERPTIKENKLTGQVDMEDEISDLEMQVKEMESEAMLVEDDLKAIEDARALEKETGIFGKVYKVAVDCILRGE